MKTPILVVALLLVFSSLAIATADHPVSVSQKSLYNNAVPGNLYAGNLTIYPDGSVSNSSLISQTGNSYFLEANLSGTLTVLCNNSVIYSNGFAMVPAFDYAVYVNNTVGVTLAKLNITATSSGISVFNSYNFELKGSNITAYTALYFDASSNILISHCNISAVSHGVYLQQSPVFTMNYSTIYAQIGFYTDDSTTFTAFNGDAFTVSQSAIQADGAVNNYVSVRNSTLQTSGSASQGVYITSAVSNHDYFSNNTIENFTQNGIYCYPDYGAGYTVSDNTFLNDATAIKFWDVINATIVRNDIQGSTLAVYGQYDLNVFVTWNHISNLSNSASYAIELKYNGQAALISHNVFNPNQSMVSLSFKAIYIDGASSANVSYNTVTNSSYAIYLQDVHTVKAFCNYGINDATGIYFSAVYLDNVQIIGNTFLNGSGTLATVSTGYGYGIYASFQIGTNWAVNNNTFSDFEEGIYISFDVMNITINGNHLYNIRDEAIASYYNSNQTISWNVIDNTNTYQNFAIDVEDAVIGTVISHNMIVMNNSTGQNGILIYGSSPVLVYDNSVVNTNYSLHIVASGYITAFDNVLKSSEYGIHSLDSLYDTMYSNTISNSNVSLSSNGDYGTVFYGNTFQNATQQMIEIVGSVNTTLYHNNFINGSIVTANLSDYTNLFWNLLLPIGGNYWSNYTGTFSSGIGTTPYVVNGNSTDYLPLENLWNGYTVTFVENGLPVGTAWAVNLGSSMISSNTASIVFNPQAAQLVNQTYTVGAVSGYIASSASGSVYLNGNSHAITITFTPYTYNVTFTESTLPAGTSWSVTLNGNTGTSTTGTITFSVANGTYSYTIGSVTGYNAAVSSGTVTVNGAAPQPVTVAFSLNTHTLTVNELGLPSGDSWTFALNGVQHTSTTNIIILQVTSGTYTINASGPSGYNVSVQNSLTVNNGNATVTVTFTAVNTTTPPPSTGTSSAGLYTGLGVGVVVGAVVASLAMMFYTGTGVFSRMKKGKGGNP